MLVALNQLRLFLTQRDKAFPSLVYFGTEPLDGGSEMVDVLVSTIGSVECRWYFSVAGGALAGFDTRLAEDTDACEIRFREMGTFDGVRFPSEIVIRHGDTEFATFRVLTSRNGSERWAAGLLFRLVRLRFFWRFRLGRRSLAWPLRLLFPLRRPMCWRRRWQKS